MLSGLPIYSLGSNVKCPLHDQKSYRYILDIDSNTLDNRDDTVPFFHCLHDRMSQISNSKVVKIIGRTA